MCWTRGLGKLVRFLDLLRTKLNFHCFERSACLGLDIGIQKWMSLKEPINFDIETVLGFALSTFMR